jgi:hypothetical protein
MSGVGADFVGSSDDIIATERQVNWGIARLSRC